jgi:O-antigen/teichoic acid export membrane protein
MTQFYLFARRISLIGLTQLIVSLQGLILLPILTKNLSIESYGMWAQIMVTIGLIPNIALFGLPYTMVRYIPGLENKKELQETFYSIFSIVLLSTALFSTILYIYSDKIAVLVFDGNLTVAHTLSVIVLFECLISFLVNYLRAKQYIKKYTSIILSKTLLMISIVGYFVDNGYGIEGAVYGLLVIEIIQLIILTFLVYKDIGFKVPQFKNLKEYLNFGIPTVPGNLSSWVVNSSDRYVIGVLLGASFVGYYSPGYSLGSLIGMFIAPLSFLLPSILSENYDKNKIDNVKIILEYSFKYFMIIAIPSVFGLSFLSKPLLTILTTTEIAEQGYLITPLVATSTLFFGAYAIIIQIIMLEKKTHISGKIWIFAAVLNLGLNFLLIPYIGIIGAALTTLLAFSFSFIATFAHSNKLLSFDMSFKPILKSVFSSSLMAVPLLIYEPINIGTMFLMIMLCTIIYFKLMCVLKSFDKEEIKFIKNIFNQKG